MLKIRGKGAERERLESTSKSRMEEPALQCEGSAEDAADGAGGELGLEVEIVGAAVEIPAGGRTGISRSEEADDVESDAPGNTLPSEEGQVNERILTHNMGFDDCGGGSTSRSPSPAHAPQAVHAFAARPRAPTRASPSRVGVALPAPERRGPCRLLFP